MNKNCVTRQHQKRKFIDAMAPPLLALALDCNKCGSSLDEPMVSQVCLHRFCTACIRGLTKCPECDQNTNFKIDLNFALIISKLNSCGGGKRLVKRRIVDVLRSDGIDLNAVLTSGGRLSSSSQPKPATDQSPMDHYPDPHTGDDHFVHPSTSSSVLLNGDLHPPSLLQSADDPAELLASQDGTRIPNANMDFGPNIINYIPTTPTTSKTSPLANTKPGVDLNQWDQRNNGTGSRAVMVTSNRRPLAKDYMGYEAIVLWPDGENYKLKELPRCLLRPRYLLVPPETTVAHLIQYLYKRAELEAKWRHQSKFRVELMPVEEEREELHLWIDPVRNIDYLARNLTNKPYMLVVKKMHDLANFNTNLIMRHPFKALSEHTPVEQLIREHNARRQRSSGCGGRDSAAAEGADRPEKQRQQQQRPNSGTPSLSPSSSSAAAAEGRPLKVVYRFLMSNNNNNKM